MPRSNIVFGFDDTSKPSEWRTTTGEHLARTKDAIKLHGAGAFTETVNVDNKSVHWKLGDAEADYSTSNALPDPRGAGLVQLKSCKGAIKKTNVSLGFDAAVDYKWKQGMSFEELARHTDAMVREKQSAVVPDSANGKKNIVWGFDKPAFETETTARYVDCGAAGRGRGEERAKIKQFVKELQTCAVHFGSDPVDYSTSNRLPAHTVVQERVGKVSGGTSNKLLQQRSSIVYGYAENEYVSSMKAHYPDKR